MLATCLVTAKRTYVRWPGGAGLFALGIIAMFGGLSVAQVRGQPPKVDGKVLFVVEMVRTAHSEKDADRLLRLNLTLDGKLHSETVLTAKARFFGDPAKARIVDGRYIVTQAGNVVDAKEKQIINERGHVLLGVEKGQVFYRVYNHVSPSFPGTKISKERAEQLGDFAFDLEKHTRKRPDAKHWSRGFLVTHSKYAHNTFDRTVPILWLDHERTLTQQANGKLVTVDMQGKLAPVCDISGVPAVLDSPRLWLDPKDRIIYSCGRAQFVIDVKKKTASVLEEYALGHGFETPVETEARGFRTIYFEGQAIGASVFSPADVRTAPEVIAKHNLGADGSRRYLGVLWTKLGFAWRGIDLDYGGVIGWAN